MFHKYNNLFAVLLYVCLSPLALAHETPNNANDISPILIGQKIPALVLKDPQGKDFDLLKNLQKKPSLLVFYCGGWCPYCNTHLQDLRKIEKTLLDKGFQILAISPDLPEHLAATDKQHKLGYQLLSDSKMEAAKALGLAFKVDNKTLDLYKTYNIDLEKSSSEKHHLLPVPAALLVNTEGEVTFTFISPNYKIRVANELILTAADLQLKTVTKE